MEKNSMYEQNKLEYMCNDAMNVGGGRKWRSGAMANNQIKTKHDFAHFIFIFLKVK